MKNKAREMATETRQRAYAPYSGFLVGAALVTDGGEIFTGCNVENVSFGLTMCAERVCVGKAVAAGKKTFTEITIVTESEEPVVPCGACRQVMAEFNPDLRIQSWTLAGAHAEFSLGELFPLPRQGILENNVPRGT
jgi:cytidine deaminase